MFIEFGEEQGTVDNVLGGGLEGHLECPVELPIDEEALAEWREEGF